MEPYVVAKYNTSIIRTPSYLVYSKFINRNITFNEKLQWLKLHVRKPLYAIKADKYRAKKRIANQIGNDYIVPDLGKSEDFDDIDFETLPVQLLLKCNRDCGSVIICKDKRQSTKRLQNKL